MADQRFTFTIGADMDVSGVIGAVKQMQGAFNGLKLPPSLTTDMVKDFEKLKESLRKFEAIAKQDHFSKGDLKSLEKLQKEIDATFGHLSDSFKDLSGQKIYLEADATKIKEVSGIIDQLKADIQTKLSQIKIDFSTVQGSTASLGLDTLLSRMEQGVKTSKTLSSAMAEIGSSISAGDLGAASEQFTQMMTKAQSLKGASAELLETFRQWGIIDFSGPAKDIKSMEERSKLLEQAFRTLLPIFGQDSEAIRQLSEKLAEAVNEKAKLEEVGRNNFANTMNSGADAARNLAGAEREVASAAIGAADATSRTAKEVEQLKTSTQYFFSLRNMINLFKRGIKEAVKTVKELDAAMTETAVVTNFDIGDMWEKLPEYTANANALGATVLDMYKSTTLYYQQGLNSQQAMEIATETMKMARIAGMDAAEATDMMTAALRGFNMEINETSAERINDVYSNLAAKTASNTEELGTAMQRTASIAHSAGMSFEGTAAFLAQAIETTREPAENLGTAMKTIVARFTELKKNPLEITEVDGEEVSYNKVDTALQSIGVSLKDANGQFRDLDKVFLDISQRWDSLSQTQQRYIATTAAGSRQQSRFIAMMSNYERTMQLMGYANDSAGASTSQFNKTLDSLEAKLNKFQNAWKEFLMGIMNDKWTKRLVDAATGVLNIVNKVINALSFGGKAGLLKSVLSTYTAFTALRFAGRGVNALIGGLGGSIDPKSNFRAGARAGVLGRNSAQAINQPIVKELQSIRALLAQKIGQSNLGKQSIVGPYDEYHRFQAARSGIIDMKGRGSVDALLKHLSGLSASSQNALMRGNAATFRGATNAIIDKYGSANRSEVRAGERFLNNQRKSAQLTAQEYYTALQDPGLLKKAMVKAGVSQDNAAYKYIDGLDKQITQQAEKITQERRNARWVKFVEQNPNATEEEQQAQREKINARYDSKKWQDAVRKKAIEDNENIGGKTQFNTSGFGKALDGIGRMGSAVTQAGMGLQAFGSLLTSSANPALQVFGTALTSIGGLLSGLGMGISGVAMAFTELAGSQVMEAIASRVVTAAKQSEAIAGLGVAGVASAITGILFVLVAAIGLTAALIKRHNDKIKKEAEEVTQNYKDKSSENQSNIANLKQWKSELATLSKGVDENGYNVSLDATDYDHYLEIVDAIAKMNPEIVQGYNAQGHAIIDNNKALEETLALEEQREKKLLKDYTSPESLRKLLKARNLERRRNAGGGSGTNYVETLEYELKPRTDMRKEISKIGVELRRNKDLIDLSSIGVDIEALASGSEAEFKKVLDNYDVFEKLVYNSIEDAGDSWSDASRKAIEESFSAFQDSSAELDELVNPIYEALSASATQTSGFKEMSNELKVPFQKALKELATNAEFSDEKELDRAAKNMASKFASYNDAYMDAMDKVAVANKQYALDFNEVEYNTNTEEAIAELEALKNTLEDTPEGHAISEWVDNEIAKIENHTSSAAKTVEEAWDTISDKVAVAESALESFNNATEKDLYTAADNMKQIYDTVMDEEAYHTIGLGDDTFWTGAESLLGVDNIMDKTKNEVLGMMKDVEPFLREGPEGVQNFADKVAELSPKLEEIAGVHMGEDGWFESIDENVNPDAWKQIADYLGVSEELLTSLINKSRQFRPWDFSDLDAIREAYSVDESVIHGTQKVDVTTTNKQGEEETVKADKLFITDAEFRAQMGTDYYNKQKREDKESQLASRGIEVLPEHLKDLSANLMKTQMGITDWKKAIQVFGDTGAYEKEDIYDAAKKVYEKELGRSLTEEEEGDFRKQFSDEWTNWLDSYENPLMDPVTSMAADVAGIAGKVLGEAPSEANKKEKENKEDKKEDSTETKSPTTTADKATEYANNNRYKNKTTTSDTSPDPYTEEEKALYSRNSLKTLWDGLTSRIEQSAEKRAETEQAYKNNISERTGEELVQQNKDWWGRLFSTANEAKEEAKEQKTYGSDESSTGATGGTEKDGSTTGGEALTEAANQLITGINSLSTAGDGLNLAATNLTNAAAVLAAGSQNNNKGNISNGMPAGAAGPPAPNQQSSASGIIVVDNSPAKASFEELQAKAAETKTQIETPMNVSIEVSDNGLKAAAKRVKTINEGAGDKNINVTATTSDPEPVNKLKEAINSFNSLKDHTVKLTTNLKGDSKKEIKDMMKVIDDFHKKTNYTVTLKTKKVEEKATGARNHGSSDSLPSFNSAAGGYGQLGPKGKGGLTLTGELGYEIAWLPSENRSMILGANGPQMVNLPGDAVVWTHEQSKKILNQKGIPAGSHSGPTSGRSTGGWDYSGWSGGGGSTGSYKKRQQQKNNKSTSKAVKEVEKLIQKGGKVLVWWENAAHRMDKAQHNAEISQKKLSQLLKQFGVTGEQYRKLGKDYEKYLDQQFDVANQKKARADAELNMTDKGANATLTYLGKKAKTTEEKAAQQAAKKKLDNAKAQLKKAKKTKSKKDDKKAQKAVDKAQAAYNKTTGATKDKTANAYLEAIGARREISYEVTKKKKNKKGKWKTTKETKKETINLAGYITQDTETGAYQIDQAAISAVAKTDKSKAEAIKQAAEQQLNDLISKQQAAEKEAIEAAEALDDFYNETYETFGAWERTITEAYLLAQDLERLSGLRNIFQGVEDLELAKLEAGFSEVSKSLPIVNQALQQNKDLLLQQVQANAALAQAKYDEYKASLSYEKQLANSILYQGTAAAADADAIRTALDFLESVNQSENFDYEAAVTALNAREWQQKDYDKIKDGLDKIAEKQTAYYDALTQSYQTITEVYQLIEEYQSYMADFENSLISGIEEQTNKEIDKLSKLNSALSDAAKDLIDEVKRKLDERRKQEDNAKTEQDISQKQQRLAALRADTSGGHQVEIAQLEKEIAEAQQNYNRTLEDQLLDRLSAQQDDAAKQRERQINLLEAQRDLAAALGTNVAEVNEWLKDPNKYKEQIRSAWLANQNYDDKGEKEQKQLREQFEKAWTQYLAYAGNIDLLEELVKQNELPEGEQSPILSPVEQINQKMDTLLDKLSEVQNLSKTFTIADLEQDENGNTRSASQVRQMLEANGQAVTAKEFEQSSYGLEGTTSAFSAAEMKAEGYKVEDIKDSYTTQELKEGGYTAQEFGAGNFDYKTAREVFGATELTQVDEYKTEANKELQNNYSNALATLRKKGSKFTYNDVKAVADAAKVIGKHQRTFLPAIVAGKGSPTWVELLKVIKSEYSKYRLARTFTDSTFKTAYDKVYGKGAYKKNRAFALKNKTNQNKYPVYAYESGGLASYTGPAWLDGTPSKPELVLSATDTKNFLALRDVLGSAMKSAGSVNNSYGGDVTYEVNINVDHLNSDYDVDKVAERVKKIIVKDSSYRNVTQVRNFR